MGRTRILFAQQHCLWLIDLYNLNQLQEHMLNTPKGITHFILYCDCAIEDFDRRETAGCGEEIQGDFIAPLVLGTRKIKTTRPPLRTETVSNTEVAGRYIVARVTLKYNFIFVTHLLSTFLSRLIKLLSDIMLPKIKRGYMDL